MIQTIDNSKMSSILIVDDTPENLSVLSGMLKSEKYEVRPALNGAIALRAAQNNPPDIILLDICMPDMDGYEVCKILKANEKLKEIPVIFISALTETIDKVKAFSLGCVDYITKPFQFEEVNARIKTHIDMSKLKLKLKMHNEDLEKIVEERTRELTKTYGRLNQIDKLKSEFMYMIAHEFRTPLSGILGVAESLVDIYTKKNTGYDARCLIEIFNTSRERILKLLEDAMMINSLEISKEKFVPRYIPVNTIITFGAEGFNYSLNSEFKELLAPVEFSMIKSTMETINLLAKCFIKKVENIKLDVYIENQNLYLKYQLDNLPVSEAGVENFFELSSNIRSSTYAQKLGLSPIAAQKMLNLFGGDLKLIKYNDDYGCLLVTIPVKKNDDN